MQSKATTVKDYLASLPPDRRAEIQAVRDVILRHIDPDIAECMSYGMIGYAIPKSIYPPGYHCAPDQPLPYAGLASQKSYLSLYFMCVYGEDNPEMKRFRQDWAKSGKKLDMGKACIRFKRAADLDLDAIAKLLGRVPASTYITRCEQAIASRQKPTAKTSKKPAAAPKAKSKPTRAATPKATKTARPKARTSAAAARTRKA